MPDDRAAQTRLTPIPRALVVAALAAFLLKTVIALSTYGSTDVLIFEADLTKIRQDGGVALYRDGIRTEWCGQAGQWTCPAFNHPPFIILALEGWATLARISNAPLRFWLRFTCAVADLGSFMLLVRILSARRQGTGTQMALLMFTASPVAILLSGFHGNTDPILIFFVLLSIHLIESRKPAWLPGAALGMAMNVKILPVLLAPAALLALRGTRRKLAFLAGAGTVFGVASLPFLLAAPRLVIGQVFGYDSQSGTWGLSLLSSAFRASASFAWLSDAYARHGKILSLGLVLAASIWPHPRLVRNELFLRGGFVMFLFMSSIPGFGVQYLAWLVPWVVALGAGATAAYYVAGTVFLVTYYDAAAGRFPWHLANSLARPAWTGPVLFAGLICWVVVCCIALGYARRLAASGADSSEEERSEPVGHRP